MVRFILLSLVLTGGVAAAVVTLEPEAEAGGPELHTRNDGQADDLDDRREMYRSRLEFKQDLVRRLTSGEITLSEATSAFLELNRDVPEVLDVVRAAYVGSSDEEKTAANLLDYVQLADVPAAQKGIALARLGQEYKARYGFTPIPRM